MEKERLKEIIVDQNSRKQKERIITRDVFSLAESYIKNKFITIITGIRRCGKSTLLNQLINKYPGHYFNFDDDRLVSFNVEDFQKLYEALIELYGEKKRFYFDEVQNSPQWERFVRRLYDEGNKIVITGSNSSMLSKELGSRLTGRYLNLEVFPFSFKEFLTFKEIKLTKESLYKTSEKSKIKNLFNEYLLEGGFPEYVEEGNKEYLKMLYENIIYRDILARYNITNEKTFKEIVYQAITNTSKEISFNSLKKQLSLKSSTTVKEYFNYLVNSYLISLVPRFDFSLKRQISYNKKVYCIDNGFANYIGYKFSHDSGKVLENLVFSSLRRTWKEIYYFQEKNECDFILKEGRKISKAIQVCYTLNEENKEREIAGLVEAMEKFNLKQGSILTNDQEEEFNKNGKKIKVKPVWKWLLE